MAKAEGWSLKALAQFHKELRTAGSAAGANEVWHGRSGKGAKVACRPCAAMLFRGRLAARRHTENGGDNTGGWPYAAGLLHG